MQMLGIGLGALLAGAMAAQPAGGPAMPGWMAGCWIEQKGAGAEAVWAEECWTTARGGVMIGSGRTGQGDRVKFWEAMQILREGADLFFYAAPRGLNRTRFQARADSEGVTFANPGHDYPQRVRYWREGEFLNAETAMADGSRAQRWRFKRM